MITPYAGPYYCILPSQANNATPAAATYPIYMCLETDGRLRLTDTYGGDFTNWYSFADSLGYAVPQGSQGPFRLTFDDYGDLSVFDAAGTRVSVQQAGGYPGHQFPQSRAHAPVLFLGA